MSLATEYDKWHTKVFESDPEHADESSPWYQLVLEFLPPVEGKKVLEIACGRGGFSRLLASRGATVWGADFSESAVAIAKDRLLRDPLLVDHVTYVQVDAQDMPFEENSFDLVISCETIEHVPDPRAAVREMHRVCKPGGTLFLTTPNYMNLMGLYEIYSAVRKRKILSGLEQPLDRHYVFFQIRRFVQTAGWQIIATNGTVHQVPLGGGDPLTLRLPEKTHTLRRLLHPFALHYLVVGRKAAIERCES